MGHINRNFMIRLRLGLVNVSAAADVVVVEEVSWQRPLLVPGPGLQPPAAQRVLEAAWAWARGCWWPGADWPGAGGGGGARPGVVITSNRGLLSEAQRHERCHLWSLAQGPQLCWQGLSVTWPGPGDWRSARETGFRRWIENEGVLGVLFTRFVLCYFMSDPRFSCIVTITWLLWRNVTWCMTIWPLVWISKSDTCDTCEVTHLVTWTRDWCWCCEGSWLDWPFARLILRQLAVFSGSEMDC